MQTVTYEGTLTAISSISHGGQDRGITHGFRKETIIGADGRPIGGIPVISGSVIRGTMRRKAARLMQTALSDGGDSRLPFHSVHALTTGGSMTETRSSGEVLTVERQARVRDLIPLFGVFGVAGGGKVMSGKLSVDKAIPIARETAHLTPSREASPLSVFSLVQREQYSRVADVENGSASGLIAPTDEAQVLPSGSGQMLYQIETLAAGTVLQHSVTIEDANPVEAAFFDDVLRAWRPKGVAQLGGQSARGLGKAHVDYVRTTTDVWGDEVEPEVADWKAFVRDHRADALEALAWL